MPAPQEFHDSTLYLIRSETAVSSSSTPVFVPVVFLISIKQAYQALNNYVISCQIALFKISLAKMFQSLPFSVVIEKTNYGK
ncbi:hypothetical protein PN480_10730 [Dolichospermum circinale CS-1225]|nr:hypothetical protein [Dolichospermum circinale CS-1225]